MPILTDIARGSLDDPLFSPLAHWWFGNTAPGAATVADLSGNGRSLTNLTTGNPRVLAADGCVGSYSLQASTGYRRSSDAALGMNGATSVELVLPSGPLGSMAPISAPGYAVRVVATTGVGFVWQQGNGGALTADTGDAVTTKATSTTNVGSGLVHLVFTRASDGQTVKCYAFGKLISTTVLAAIGAPALGNTEVGMLYGTAIVQSITLVSVWNVELTARQVLHAARKRLGFTR